ncbi:threonine aldolase family protein [Streptomyces spectabilis]|uniref:Threonine aldolase n=1 Tax=Streptomyces spectabilis TaxID=68270 RepID=A0A5P2XCD0_STRST|nr:beta-eliminating lyase-related protein [Streptomyces spectabilis]MBB5103530.1 threonine aldolase [Streptomyces spectabilis]MCI3904224.1 beta-eliminating lyase-related protein [Streptomyces spectabilis]QEV61344.1 threonine aldolase [Streptomyces spectabilis]GGV20258.1 threonine aldolase [Streptomyces spectabilis]
MTAHDARDDALTPQEGPGADGTEGADGTDGAGADGAEGRGEPDEQARRIAAARGARRLLARPPTTVPLGERLAALAAGAADVADLAGPTDMYGDGVVADLEDEVARLLGKEAAAFFPTGTMAQQVALRCWAGRTGNATVALHPRSHPEVHEGGALATVSGLRTVHPADAPRPPTAEEVRDFEEPFGTLMLELPLREPGFLLPTWDELQEVVAAARERDAVVHFDGARLWECTPHFGRPLDEIAGLADSVYVSFYKSLEGIAGAALAGPQTLVEEARAWRHRYGGLGFQQFPTALSALLGLRNVLPRLPEYVSHARVVADALREALAASAVPWSRVHPEPPHTHQFQVWLPYPPDVLNEAALTQAEETKTLLFWRWFPDGPPGLSVTEVTVNGPGLAWTADDVREAVAEFVRRLP